MTRYPGCHASPAALHHQPTTPGFERLGVLQPAPGNRDFTSQLLRRFDTKALGVYRGQRKRLRRGAGDMCRVPFCLSTIRTSRNQKGCLQPGKSYKIVEHAIHRANTPRHFGAKSKKAPQRHLLASLNRGILAGQSINVFIVLACKRSIINPFQACKKIFCQKRAKLYD